VKEPTSNGQASIHNQAPPTVAEKTRDQSRRPVEYSHFRQTGRAGRKQRGRFGGIEKRRSGTRQVGQQKLFSQEQGCQAEVEIDTSDNYPIHQITGLELVFKDCQPHPGMAFFFPAGYPLPE
jgi:hypothetical protein